MSYEKVASSGKKRGVFAVYKVSGLLLVKQETQTQAKDGPLADLRQRNCLLTDHEEKTSKLPYTQHISN